MHPDTDRRPSGRTPESRHDDTAAGQQPRTSACTVSPASLRSAAIAAAQRGRAVFPLRPSTKRPAVNRWERRATADPERVARWWPASANIGIACGPSRLVVVDLDCHGDLPPDWAALAGVRDGRDVLAQLCDWAGEPWPSTHTVATPSAGWHLYFAAPVGQALRNTAGAIGPQIDTRAAGGYVVGAGSIVDNRTYQTVDDRDPVPLPPWLLRLMTDEAPRQPRRVQPAPGTFGGSPRRLDALCGVVADAAPGERNHTLYWAACRAAELIRGRPRDIGHVTDVLSAAAVSAGLPEAEARRTVASGLRGDAW